MRNCFLILVFAAGCTDALAQNSMPERNFITYFSVYRDFLLHTNIYGQQISLQMQFMGARQYPLPEFPNEVIKGNQDALCGTLKVKQKKFSISKKGNFITDYDEQGRVTKFEAPEFIQTFQYFTDSIKEDIVFKPDYSFLGEPIKCIYDNKKRLVRMVMIKPGFSPVLCERTYAGDKLMRSFEMYRDLDHSFSKPEIFTFTYNDVTSQLESVFNKSTLHSDNTYTFSYDSDEPGKVTYANGVSPIYNMQGRLIDCKDLKINYNENGTMKSYTHANGWNNHTLEYAYDEKSRLVAVTSSYSEKQTTTYSYRDNGLLDKIRGAKVKYDFY